MANLEAKILYWNVDSHPRFKIQQYCPRDVPSVIRLVEKHLNNISVYINEPGALTSFRSVPSSTASKLPSGDIACSWPSLISPQKQLRMYYTNKGFARTETQLRSHTVLPGS